MFYGLDKDEYDEVIKKLMVDYNKQFESGNLTKDEYEELVEDITTELNIIHDKTNDIELKTMMLELISLVHKLSKIVL